MSMHAPLRSPPCVQCAHAGATCRCRNRNVRCNRCLEKDLDCSLRRSVRARDVDLYLPEVISNIEDILERDGVRLQSIADSQENLIVIGKEILHEMRKFSSHGHHVPEGSSSVGLGPEGRHVSPEINIDSPEAHVTHHGSDDSAAEVGLGKGKGISASKNVEDESEYLPSSPGPSTRKSRRTSTKRMPIADKVVHDSQSEPDKLKVKAKTKARSFREVPRSQTLLCYLDLMFVVQTSETLSDNDVGGPRTRLSKKRRSTLSQHTAAAEETDQGNNDSTDDTKYVRGDFDKGRREKFEGIRNKIRPRPVKKDSVVVKKEKE
uniref:Transcription factor Cmr1 n=1 Tax=Ganoderma boninense TaxID=34458 RepID=A0A5K1JWA8_9APHY|nr:Transcription factor Cmr1 [Ganoderma boninense]